MSRLSAIISKARLDEKATAIKVKEGGFHAWLGKPKDAKITAADIAKGKAAGGHAAKMATFAQNFAHIGEEALTEEKTASEEKAIVRKFRKNEDENYHFENAVHLAKHFGTPEEHAEGQKHLRRIKVVGGQSHPSEREYADRMYKNHSHKLLHLERKHKMDEAVELDEGSNNEGHGFHGEAHTHAMVTLGKVGGEANDWAHEHFDKAHEHITRLTRKPAHMVKHYLDSSHGRHMFETIHHAMTHHDHHVRATNNGHIEKDFKKFGRDYNPMVHEETLEEGGSGSWMNHGRSHRSLKTGYLEKHPWIGKKVQYHHEGQTKTGTVQHVERAHTFSQMVPYVTLVHVKHDDGTETNYHSHPRKDHVRLVKEETVVEAGQNPHHDTAGIKRKFKDMRAKRIHQNKQMKEEILGEAKVLDSDQDKLGNRFEHHADVLHKTHAVVKTHQFGKKLDRPSHIHIGNEKYIKSKWHETKKRLRDVDSGKVTYPGIQHESLSKDADASDYIHDFVHSKNKVFAGDSTKQRIKRALGAYYHNKK